MARSQVFHNKYENKEINPGTAESNKAEGKKQ
jgi:hypothetical protein